MCFLYLCTSLNKLFYLFYILSNSTVDLTILKYLVDTDRFRTSLHKHPLVRTTFPKFNTDNETTYTCDSFTKKFERLVMPIIIHIFKK